MYDTNVTLTPTSKAAYTRAAAAAAANSQDAHERDDLSRHFGITQVVPIDCGQCNSDN